MNTSPLTEIVQVKQAAEADLLARPGVTGVDVGYKVVRGQITESVAIRVLVEQKRDVGPDEAVPREIEGVPTDVIQRRYVLHPLSVPVEELTPLTDSGTYDPVKGGISIGPCRVVGGRVFAGTLGAVVRDRQSGSPLLLSNFHVMCVDNGWSAGDTVAQPSRVDGGNCPADVVGAVLRASLGDQIDCAVAALSGRRYVCEIAEIGAPTGTGTASLGTAVHKRGRTTGLSHGVVDSVDLTVALDYGNGLGRVTLAHQIGIRVDAARNPQFGNHGDSGSVVVNDARQVVGLYFAGTDDGSHGVANPIRPVLDALQVDLCTSVPSAPSTPKTQTKEVTDLKLKDQAPDKLVVKETAADKPEEGAMKKPEKLETEKLDKLPKIEKQEKSEKPELADHKAWKEIKFEKNEIKEHKHEKLEKNEIKEHKHEIKELAKDHKPEIKEVALEKPLSDNKLADKLADGKLAEIDPTGPLGPLGPLPLQPGFATTLEAQAGAAAVTPIKKIEKLELEKVSIKTEQKDTKLEHKDKNEKLEHKDKIEKIEHKDKNEKLEKHEPKEHKHEIKEHKPEIKELAKEVKELAKEIKEFQPEKLAKEGFPEKGFAEGKLEDKLADVGPFQPAQPIQPIQPIEPAQPVQPGAAASGAPPAAAKTIEKLPAEKLVLKREKIEKLELKEWKIEKFEHKEWKIESKEFIFEKLQFEQKLQDKLADTGPIQPGQVQPLQPGQASSPAAAGAGTVEARVANLEAAVAQLSHFIPAELRPDLSRGALTNEPGGTEPGAPAPEATADGGGADGRENQEGRGGEPGGTGGSTGGQGGSRRGNRGGRGSGGGDHE